MVNRRTRPCLPLRRRFEALGCLNQLPPPIAAPLLQPVARKLDELALPDIQRMDREVATTLRHLVNSDPTPGGTKFEGARGADHSRGISHR